MNNKVNNKSFKEFFRKLLVSLKRRPHNIALVFMLITYIVYSFNLSIISHTTAVVCKQPMGLCSFIVMLFSLLSMVSFLNAFPIRQKAKVPMVIIMYLIQAIVLAADIIYLLKIEEGITQFPEILKPENAFILQTRTIVLVHCIMIVLSTCLIALIPVIGKLLNKINTSIEVEESTGITRIDIDND